MSAFKILVILSNMHLMNHFSYVNTNFKYENFLKFKCCYFNITVIVIFTLTFICPVFWNESSVLIIFFHSIISMVLSGRI